ncbi:AAA family ATPase [Solirubrobacter ginsenosidimutans]|uniref:AAA family ATPase n=1 Tax=Solirubrobacter ginsenosidimutans TaxID=490573 RepID=A0A9X3MS94_9ACTN|nr:helix-turn-helix transcriptional regulator [Solirubrobacter ginsenosidimutans]MDA0160235.1 AAA family ATPase [Solirubrobacter ginsenosidimutans]
MKHRSMVGRDVPLRELEAALAAPPRVALVSGEAGIGKTRLVAELEARADGWLVLHGECLEFGGEEVAYAPVVAALRDLPAEWLEAYLDERSGEARAALAAVFPRESPGGGGPGRLYELLLDLLGALECPVLLVLEDLHWADRSTLTLLAFLARNLRAQPIVVVATYRTDDALPADLRRLAGELRRRRTVLDVELAPLARDDVARQLEAIGGPVSASLVDELHARAGGNPFFVETLFEAGAETLTEAVLARVERLDASALAVLAAAGGRATYELLDGLAVDPDALRAGLDAGVLVRERDGLAFRHGLIGEVVYDRLLPTERAELHRAIAARLDDPAQRAHHCHRAGLRAEALAASVEAGIAAADVFAYAEAAVHFERALELADASVDRVDLLARAAQAARFTGDPERAVALCREAIALESDGERRARLYERLGEYQFWDDAAALECYEAALALTPRAPRLLAAKGHALMGLRRWDEARACCEAGLAAGAAPRITLGVVLAFLGEAEAGEAHLRRALEVSESGEETARAYLHLGELLRVRGDHRGALQAMVEGEQAAARLGLRGSFGHFMYVNGADDLLRLGRWDEASERVGEAARMDLSRTARALRRAVSGQLHALRGAVETARRELDAAEDAELPAEFLTPLAAARATLALTEGDPVAAAVHVAGALGGVEDPFYTPPLYSLGLRVEAELAERDRARRRTPDRTRAAELLAGLTALAGGEIAGNGREVAAMGGEMASGGPEVAALGGEIAGAAGTRAAGGSPYGAPPGALAHLALARAELSRVDGTPAPELWHAVAEAFDALHEPYPAAYARLREAEAALVTAGDRARAAVAVAAARETADGLGAAPLRDAAEALARSARLTIACAPVAAADDDGTGLTVREVEVLGLLAEGLTNRQIASRLFISQKTVGAHMAHIYAKLGVHSRVEAAGRARQLGV